MSSTRTSNPLVVAAALVIVIGGVIYAQSLVTSILMALFISIICAQPIFWLRRKGLPQTGAIVLVFVAILVLSFGLGEVIGRSLSSFSKQVPIYEENINGIERTLLQFFTDMGIRVSAEEFTGQFDPSKLMGITAGILGQLGSFLGNAFTIVFLVLFLLLELDSFPIKVRAIFGEKSTTLNYFDVIADNIRHYLTIKTLTSLFTGLIVWILLAIIGLDYAILWGLIAFLLNYIPNIGSFVAAVPAVLFAIIQLSFGGVIGTIVVFLAANLFIGSFVEPRLMGQGLGLSTFVVFFSLIFWGFALGTVGMFLSVPLTIAIKIILEQNPATRGAAIALGTQAEAQQILDSSDNDRN